MIQLGASRMLGAARLRGARPAQVDAAVRAARGGRRVGARRAHRGDRAQPSAVRLPLGVRAPAARRLAREPQARAPAVPPRGPARAAEKPQETAPRRVCERDRAAEGDASERRVVLGLRRGQRLPREAAALPDARRRVHARVPAARGGAVDDGRADPRPDRGGVQGAWCAEAPQERQRLGVHRDEAEAISRGGEGGDALHRAGRAVAERLRRELQRKAARRAAELEDSQGSSPTSARRRRSRRTGGTSTTTRGRTARSGTMPRPATRRGLPPLRSGLRPFAPRRQARKLCFR
jgi:hypothetical protein